MFSRLQLPLPAILLLSTLSLSSAFYDTQYQQVFSQSKDVFESVRKSLLEDSVIPDVLNDFTPQCFLAPYYGRHHRSVTLGNTIKPSKTQSAPSLKIYCPYLKPEGLNLTIVLTDPDAPSREDKKWSEFCHWVGKIPIGTSNGNGEEEGKGMVVDLSVRSNGVQELVEYYPPGPPRKTGFHRYVFVLLKGDNSNLTVPDERKSWGTGKEGRGVQDWAQREGLEVVGANFFVAKHKVQQKFL